MEKQKNSQNNKFKDAIQTSINKLAEVMDTNVIVGNPIQIENGVIIPISKITSFYC